MQGVKLQTLVKQVKVITGDSIVEGSSIDADLAMLLSLTQESLANTSDWASLETTSDVSFDADSRLGTFPSLNLNRPVLVEYRWNETWERLEYGIGAEQYNAWDVGEAADPVMRWKLLPLADAVQQFELWPTPATACTVRVTGQRALLPFTVNDDVCTLDGLLLVYYAAADRLMLLDRKNVAATLLSKANALAASLRAIEHRKDNSFSFTKYDDGCAGDRQKVVPILSV